MPIISSFGQPGDTEGLGGGEGFDIMEADGAVRRAISVCWMMLPKERRNPEALEAEVRRLFDRAITNAKEDFKAFVSKSSESIPE